MPLFARVAVSLIVAILLVSMLFYGYLAGFIGSPSRYAKWLVPVFFYTGVILCLTGVIFTLVEQFVWVRWSFISAVFVVFVFALFLLFIEPKWQQMEKHDFVKNMQRLYLQYSITPLDCDDRYQVHLSKIEQRPAEVVLFQKGNFSQSIQRLAGWDKSASMNDCRFIENTYSLGTQRRFLSQCHNQQQTSVVDLIDQAKRLGCQQG